MNAEFRINGKEIETERLVLRAFRQSDLEDFFEYASVDGVGEMAGWQHHENRAVTQKVLDDFILGDKTFALVEKKSGKVIGSLGVEKYNLEDRLSEFDGYRGRELGYVLGKSHWGMGLMPEAVQAVIAYLFDECDLDFLTCGYYAFNRQSARVQEKCGFLPYRSLVFDTKMGTKEPGVLNLLVNGAKNITFEFSHPETLLWQDGNLQGQIVANR